MTLSVLADIIERNSEDILERWTQQVKSTLVPGRPAEPELRDHMPVFLQELAAVLRRGEAPSTSAAGRAHGQQRFAQGFDLPTLVREYGLMSEVILGLAERRGQAVALGEVRRFNAFHSSAIAEAVAEHERQRMRSGQDTERRHAEELLARESSFSITLHSIGDAVISTDARARITFLNPVAEQLTGWSHADAQGLPLAQVFRIIHEHSRQSVESPVERVLAEGTVQGLASHTLLVRKDGSEVAIDDSAAPIRGGDGQLDGVVLIFRDISGRRAAEDVLARQARHTRLIAEVGQALARVPEMRTMLQRCAQALVERLDAASARVWLLDEATESLVLHASAGMDTHLDGLGERVPLEQFTLGRIIQERRPHLTHTLGDDPRMGNPEWARREGLVTFAGYPLLVGEKPMGVVALLARHVLPADTLDTLRLAADTMALGIGRVEAEATSVVMLTQESSARLLAEAEQQRLNSIFRQAPAAICLTEGPEHRHVLVNPRYVALVGERGLLGRTVAQALPEWVEQGFVGLLDTVYRTGVAHVGQETWLWLRRTPHAPLEHVCLDFVYQPIQDARGQTHSIFIHAVDVTERVLVRREALRVTEALRLNERRLADALAVTGAGTWEIDVATNSLTADARFREMFGLTPEEPFDLAKGLAIIHAEDRERVAALVRGALEGRDHGRIEADYRTVPRPDGSPRWVAARGQTTFDASGRATRLLGTGTDITASKEAELSRTSLLHSLANQPVFGVAVLRGEELRYEMVNGAYQQIAGERALVGKPLVVALPEIASQGTDTGMREVLRTGKPFSGQEMGFHLRETSGAGDVLEERFFSFVWQPIFDASGQADSLLALTHDVTEQVRARRRVEALLGQLAASEERLRLVVEASGIGTYSWNLLTQELVADARYYALAGMPPGTQMSVEERIALIHPEDGPHVEQGIAAARAGAHGGRFHLEYRTTRLPDGRFRWVESLGHFFWDAQGRPIRLVGTTQDITGRKEAEVERERLFKEVEAARVRLSNLIQNAPAFVCTLRGPRHVFELVNPLYQQVVGTGRELQGLSVQEALPEVVEQGFIDLLDGVYRSGEPFFGRELSIQLDRAGDGRLEEASLNFVYQPRRDARGQVEGIDVFGFEVTDQVLARQRVEALAQRLRESEARQRQVVESSGMGLWELDGGTGHVTSDARTVEFMGLPPGTAFDLASSLDQVHPEDRDLVARAVSAALEGQNQGHYFMVFRTGGRGGVPERWVESRAQRLLSADGQRTTLAGAILDITERKAAEQLRARQARLYALRAGVGQAIARGTTVRDMLQDCAGVLVEQLKAARVRIWLLLPERPELELVASDGLDPHLDDEPEARVSLGVGTVGRIAQEGRPYLTNHVQADGTVSDAEGPPHERLAAFVGCPMRVGDKRVGVLGFFSRDPLSEDAIEPLRQVADSLALGVERLRAEEALRTRVDFEQKLVGIVSHDLRNPLSAIVMGASLMAQRESLDPRAAKSLVRIQLAAERAARMVKDLLDFTQARLGGGLRIAPRPMDLHGVVRGVVEEVGVVYPTRHVELRQEGEGWGEWDVDRMAQVVQNLLTNALKYSPEDSPVQLLCRAVSGELLLSVANTGTPIPEDKLTSIFEPMQRATAEVDNAGRSVGLGLYIVKSIVAAHGGRIAVTSTPTEGTVFTVCLPRQRT